MAIYAVINETYNNEVVFTGEFEDCDNFIAEQNTVGYSIIPYEYNKLEMYSMFDENKDKK